MASIGVDGETLYIFDIDSVRVAAGYRGEMLLYSFRIYEGDELVRDFVPCISPRGEVGLYDRAGKMCLTSNLPWVFHNRRLGNSARPSAATGPESSIPSAHCTMSKWCAPQFAIIPKSY